MKQITSRASIHKQLPTPRNSSSPEISASISNQSASDSEYDEEWETKLNPPSYQRSNSDVPKYDAPEYTPECFVPKSNSPSSTQNSGSSFMLLAITLGILAAISITFVVGGINMGSPGTSETTSETKYCPFDDLQKRHPNQDKSIWRRLRIGIENILNNRSHAPGVYLFVNHGGNVYNLVKEIATQSSSCFGEKMEPVELQIDDFKTTGDYGMVIEKYKSKVKVKNSHVILIVNLNEIQPKAALALHSICDTYNPIFKDVIIFLTLTLITPDSNESAVKNTQDTLYNLWSAELPDNELGALITRVMDDVIPLKS